MPYFIISTINWVIIGTLITIAIELHKITAMTNHIETTDWKNSGFYISQVCMNT